MAGTADAGHTRHDAPAERLFIRLAVIFLVALGLTAILVLTGLYGWIVTAGEWGFMSME